MDPGLLREALRGEGDDAMIQSKRRIYTEQKFDHLNGLDGISDDQIKEHLALYAGYVKQVNTRGVLPEHRLAEG